MRPALSSLPALKGHVRCSSKSKHWWRALLQERRAGLLRVSITTGLRSSSRCLTGVRDRHRHGGYLRKCGRRSHADRACRRSRNCDRHRVELRNIPAAPKTAVFGEVGLAGELRGVSQADMRVNEAKRLGFKRCVLPSHNVKSMTQDGQIWQGSRGGAEVVVQGGFLLLGEHWRRYLRWWMADVGENAQDISDGGARNGSI